MKKTTIRKFAEITNTDIKEIISEFFFLLI